MPNWVSNNVSITAKSKSDLDAFLEKAKGADSKIKEDELEFHFGAFVHPSDEDLPYYKGELTDEKPEGWDELSSAEQMAQKLKFAGRDWYDWNVTNWGTKWDACETYVSRESDLNASVGFQTAWGIPEPLLRAMTEQHPELNFSVWAEEEQGWGAEYVGANGELAMTDEWDIPNSHADYAKRDNEDSCICSHEEDKEEWYDDCPNKRDIFVQVTKVYRLSSGNLDNARVEYFQMESGTMEMPSEEADLSSFVFVDEDGEPIQD